MFNNHYTYEELNANSISKYLQKIKHGINMSEVSITDQVAREAKNPVIWCPFLVGGNAAL